MPEPMQLSSVPASEPTTIPTLDGWIESLMTCKQLAESDVQRLCDKVCGIAPEPFVMGQCILTVSCDRLARCFKKSRMYNQWYVPYPLLCDVVAHTCVEMPCHSLW